MKQYKAIIESNNTDAREYIVDSKSAMKAAQAYGRAEGGEIVTVTTVKSGRILSRVRWTPEDGGRYYRCEI